MKISAALFVGVGLLRVGDFRMRLFAAAGYGQPAVQPAAFAERFFR